MPSWGNGHRISAAADAQQTTVRTPGRPIRRVQSARPAEDLGVRNYDIRSRPVGDGPAAVLSAVLIVAGRVVDSQRLASI